MSFFPEVELHEADVFHKEYGMLPWKFGGGSIDIGRYQYRYFPYGLGLNAYYKTGTQLMNNIEAEVAHIDSKYLIENYPPWYYSNRAIIMKLNSKGYGTDKGISFDQMTTYGLNSITAIVTRHPIYRIISSWNDKFSYNSTFISGFNYGIRSQGSRTQRD